MAKLERPDDKNTVRIVGNVYTKLSADEWVDEFVEWLVSRGESFFGHTVDVGEDEGDEEIFQGIIGDTETK